MGGLLSLWRRRGKRLVELYAVLLAIFDRRVSGTARLISGLVLVYALLPVDVIPEFIPFAGVIDDLLLASVGLSKVMSLIPDDVMNEHRTKAEAAGAGVKRVFWLLLAIVLLWLVLTIAGIVLLVWLIWR